MEETMHTPGERREAKGGTTGPSPQAPCACGHTFFMHSNNKGREECMDCPCLNFRPATHISDVTDPDRLRQMALRLWDILDDIDTASDAAKSDDAAYRRMVQALQARRRGLMVSDGYELYEVRPCPFCTQSPCPCASKHDICPGCTLCLNCDGCDCDDSHGAKCKCRECVLVREIDARRALPPAPWAIDMDGEFESNLWLRDAEGNLILSATFEGEDDEQHAAIGEFMLAAVNAALGKD